jgi:CBS domain-containing protein
MIIGRVEEDVEVLEGDEGAPEVGRHRDVGEALLRTPVSEVAGSRKPVTVFPDATVERALALMRSRKVSSVLVVERARTRRVVGLFTERDFVARAVVARGWAKARVERFMTRAPETLRAHDPVAYALEKMSFGHARHVPLVDDAGRAAGMVTAGDLVEYLVELCPEEILNLPPEPDLALHPSAEGE